MADNKEKPKIDLVRIGLDGIDVEAELASAANAPAKIDFGGMKVRVIKPKDPIEAKVKLIADKLISIADTEKFLSKEGIISEASVAEAQFGRLVQRVQSYLRRDDIWALQKLKKKGTIYYYVIRFGEKS